MNSSQAPAFGPRQLRRATVLVLALWSLAVALSAVWNVRLLHNAMLDAARNDARNNFNKDVLYRKWATMHGGVYVPVTAYTLPSPYLVNIPERDLVTPSGRRLTLMNPAYMTRQVHELETKEFGTHGHITSLKPLRPANAPDAWETNALRAFKRPDRGQFQRTLSRQAVCAFDETFVCRNSLPPMPCRPRVQSGRDPRRHQYCRAAGSLSGPGTGPDLAHRRNSCRSVGFGRAGNFPGRTPDAPTPGKAVASRGGVAVQKYSSIHTTGSFDHGILVVAENREIISSNRQFADMWGISSDIIASRSDERALESVMNKLASPEEFLNKVKNLYQARNETSRDEIALKDGRTFDRYSAPMFGTDGRYYGRVWYFRDITGRKQMEEKLRQLSTAVEQSPASIVITDCAGNIEYVNPKFIEVTGYTMAEVLGKNPRILKSGEMNPEAYGVLWQTITAGKEWSGEFHNKKKNGELYWESASISPIRDPADRITHYVAVKEDITARKQTEAERDMLIQDLQDALAHVKTLSGLLPICANCKKIRDDKGYWSQVESYIQTHTEATFTHGICPDCIKKLYPDLAEGGLGDASKETT